MDSVHLFYSWQSDRGGALCRHFIRRALDEAAARIEDERGIVVVIDSDTAGVAGTPPVTETILEKIRACDIFVADMSFVGATEEDPPKLLPNPNVMAEYGYARAVKGNDRILLVMNTAFGPPAGLPFDLQAMRYPTAYDAPPGIGDSARRTARAALTDRLVPYIGAVIDGVAAARDTASSPAHDIRERTERMVGEFDSHALDTERPVLIEQPSITVRMFPAAALDGVRIDPLAVKQVRDRFVPAGFVPDWRQDMTDARQFASFDPPRPRWQRPNPESYWYVRLLQSGFLELSARIGARINDDTTILVSGRHIEVRIVDAVRRLAGIAEAVGLGGPFSCVAALQGVEDVQIDHGRLASRPLRRPGLFLGSAFLIDAEFPAGELRPMFDAFWLEAGFDEGSPSFGTGAWDGDGDSPLYRL